MAALAAAVNRRIDLNDIRLLMQVVEHGSYTAAARHIGVPKSTISQRIAALEIMVGTGLLRRTSRSFSLTAMGMQLLPHARAVEDIARQVEHTFLEHGRELQGTLRISTSPAVAQFALSPIIGRFLEQHERVTIRVEALSRFVDLIAESFDMTIRGHNGLLKDSTLIQRVVANTKWRLAASPEWLAAHDMPFTPSDILAGQVLCFTNEPDCPGWMLRKGEESVSIAVTPRLISDDMVSLRAAAVAGAGIVCLPGYLLRLQFEAGQLVQILPEWSAQTTMISVLTPPKAQSSRLAAAFSNYLAAELPAIMAG